MAIAVQAPQPVPAPNTHLNPTASFTKHSHQPASSRPAKSMPSSKIVDPSRLPTQDELVDSTRIPILDSKGRTVQFESLHSGSGRHLIIWVRHFFCGMCQDYLRSLSEAITPSNLQSLPIPTTITVIGCGSPDLIDDYAVFSGNCPFPIYADPERKTYEAFDMAANLSLGPVSPDYQTSSLTHIIVRSIWQGISSGSLATKGGKQSQLGGEMLFEDGKVVWSHRMQNTRDHTEPDQIKKLLSL